MKKLLILTAVIAAGVAANAASFKWTGANIYGSNGTDKFNGTVDLYAYLATADISAATKVDTASVVAGVIKDGSVTGRVFSDDSLTSGTASNFYFLIEDGGKQFTSAAKTATGMDVGSANIVFGTQATATQNPSNWTSSGGGEPVPEPTSGLLMLLGAAGLALRRKRA